MAVSKTRAPAPAAATAANQPIRVTRIRFVAEIPVDAKVRREFRQPRRMVAVEEPLALAELPAVKPWPEPTGHLDVVFVPTGGDWPPAQAEAWLAPPNHAEAVPAVRVERKTEIVEWRPGQALVRARAERREEILAALTDFAFYEGELRAMEEALEAREGQAPADVAHAYRVRQRDRKCWARFKEMTEYFARMRLSYARLEPRLAHGSRTLPPEGRRLMGRLLVKADVEARLEALNDRLEAMEEIYEGANDRVADFRWYRNGHLLEIGIIVLLVFECLVMSSDMGIRYLEYQVDKQAVVEEKGLDLSEEFRAVITAAGDGKVSFKKSKELIKAAMGNEQSLPVAENVKVLRGKMDKNTNEVEAGAPIVGGLTNELFARIGDRPLRAVIVTDATNRKIAEIYVLTKKGS